MIQIAQTNTSQPSIPAPDPGSVAPQAPLAASHGTIPLQQQQQQQQHNSTANGHGTPSELPEQQHQDQNHTATTANTIETTTKTSISVSTDDIQTVQNLIERCLQLYLTKDEVTNVLKEQATVDPSFTELVWKKLEEQNPEFFKCYNTRLKLKGQIIMFNHLLEQQVAVVQKMQRGWGAGGAVPSAGISATASGIPLFQSGAGGGAGTGGGGGQGAQGGSDRSVPGSGHLHRDQVVPGDENVNGLSHHHNNNAHTHHGQSEYPFGAMPPSLDGGGGTMISPLFQSLTQVGSETDLAGLVNNALPTPGELHNTMGLLPMTSPLTLPRNFSLSDLGLDEGVEG